MSKKETLRDRIHDLVENMFYDFTKIDPAEEAEDLLAQYESKISKLVARAVNPDAFCPECHEMMIYDKAEGLLRCINCGHNHEINHTRPRNPSPNPESPVADVEDKPKSDQRPLPPAAQKVIEESQKQPEISSRGEKIRQLANSRPGEKPTDTDKSQIQGVTGTSDVNWC